jgi:hypothetical protein
MYKFKDVITNVEYYQLSDKYVYFINQSNEIRSYKDGKQDLILNLSSRCKLLLFKDSLYLSDVNDCVHNICLDINSKKITHNFFSEGVKILQLQGILDSQKIGLRYFNDEYAVYDINQEKVLFTLQGRFSMMDFPSATYFVLEDWSNRMINFYNQSTKLWELDLSGYGRLKRIFGIVDNVLWLWCEDYYFIGVDVSSGSIKKVWEVFDGVYERGRFYFYYPYFDKEEGKVYFFERNSYIECDLRNYATEILWRDKELNENISGPHFTNDYIYFTSSRLNSVFNDRLGVFDRKKMQIIWKEKFDLSQGAGFKIPNVVGDFLYVHDTGNTLHIYEKSDTSLS